MCQGSCDVALTLYAIADDHHLVELLMIFFQGDGVGALSQGYLLGLEADIRDDQCAFVGC